MAEYAFVTTASFTAPQARLFDALMEVDTWLNGWKAIEDVRRLSDGETDGLGQRFRATVRAVAPYTLTCEVTTTEAQRPHLIEWRVTGDLEGTGRWDLGATPEGTRATYHWTVATTKMWMNLLAPVARPFFEWNHNAIMRSGMQTLARAAGGELVDLGATSEGPRHHRLRALSALALVIGAYRLRRRLRRRTATA